MVIKYNPCSKQGLMQNLIRSCMALSCSVLKISQVGGCTASLGNLCPCFATLTVTGYVSWNFPFLQLVLAVYFLFTIYIGTVLFVTFL